MIVLLEVGKEGGERDWMYIEWRSEGGKTEWEGGRDGIRGSWRLQMGVVER